MAAGGPSGDQSVESIRNLNDIERRALWAYLTSVPARPFGNR